MKGNLTGNEALQIIQEMVEAARGNLTRRDLVLSLYWGYVSVGISALVYGLSMWTDDSSIHLAWLLFMPAYGFSFLLTRRLRQEKRVVTRIDKIVSDVWMAFSIAAIGIMGFSLFLGWLVLPVVLLTFSVPVMATGRILGLRPYQVGGVILLAASVLALSLEESQMLLAYIGGVFFGFLLPTHLIRKNLSHA